MDGWRDTEIQRGGESDRSAEYSNNDRSEENRNILKSYIVFLKDRKAKCHRVQKGMGVHSGSSIKIAENSLYSLVYFELTILDLFTMIFG